MRTTADECLDKVKDNVKDAVTNLTEIVINRVSGYNDYLENYQETLQICLLQLINVRNKLN